MGSLALMFVRAWLKHGTAILPCLRRYAGVRERVTC